MSLIRERIHRLIIYIGSSERNLLLFFLISAILFKMFTFFFSVIDIDESTYLIIGKEIFKGNILFVDYFDSKPIGIFLIYGLLETITGQGIFMSRLLAAILVGLTAYYLYRFKLITSEDSFASIFTGLVYLILASMYRFSYAANTEIFFVFFTVLALYILFKGNEPGRYFFGGLIAGIGFIIKYNVAFDIFAFVIYLGFLALISKISFKTVFKSWIYLGTGFILPVLIVIFYYLIIGHLKELGQFSLTLLLKYNQETGMHEYWKFFLDNNLKFLPAYALFYYFIFWNLLRIKQNPVSFFTIFWALMSGISILLLRKSNAHYVIQIFPVMAFVLGDLFIFKNHLGKYIKEKYLVFLPWTIGILLVISVINQSYYLVRTDYPKKIADYFKENLEEDELVYVSGYKHIIYYLLDQSPPTPYVHPTLFVSEHHIKKLDIDLEREIGLILDQEPRFVVFRIDPYMYGHTEYFKEHYKQVRVFDGNIFVCEREE